MRFHFHKWVPKKAFPAANGFECSICGKRIVRTDTTYTGMSIRQEKFDWLNKKEPTQ